jgi:hypothetical protein
MDDKPSWAHIPVQDEGTWPNRPSVLTWCIMEVLWGDGCINWREI